MSRLFRSASTAVPFRAHVSRHLTRTLRNAKQFDAIVSPLWASKVYLDLHAILVSPPPPPPPPAGNGLNPTLADSGPAAPPPPRAPPPTVAASDAQVVVIPAYGDLVYSLDPSGNSSSSEATAVRGAERTLLNCAVSIKPYKTLLPRCGVSGQYFSDEEVAEALLTHAIQNAFSSSFWIRPDHPDIQRGFLELKPGSVPVTVSTIAVVYPASRLAVPPASRSATAAPNENALSGFVSHNPIFEQQAELKSSSSGWVTLDQCVRHSLMLKPAAAGSSSDGKQDETKARWSLDGGLFIEIERFQLHNASELVTPGRLALKSAATSSTPIAEFDPLLGA